MKITAKMIQGYYKARNACKIVGGITHNDSYNIPNYGITQAQYYIVHKRVVEVFGICEDGQKLTLKTANA